MMLDMHTIGSPVWNGEDNYGLPGRSEMWALNIINDAWAILAQRYCSYPNVIMADIFNEPYAASWPEWTAFVQDVGSRILHICNRWHIAVEGAGQGWQSCWGEDLSGLRHAPIELPVANRLVMAPHTYGQ